MVTIKKGSDRATVAKSMWPTYQKMGWDLDHPPASEQPKSTEQPQEPEDLSSMKLEELKSLAAQAGFDIKGLKKDEIRALLESQE